MENKTISRTFRLLSQLMELAQENSFKIKTIANAAIKIDKLPYPISTKSLEEISQIEGLGKSTAGKVSELLQSGTLTDIKRLSASIPEGIIEMLNIKGLGPKKILTIWKELGIENLGELYYACNENRLIEAKGFGSKTQEEVKRLIEFNMAGMGKFLYAQVESLAETLKESLAVWISNLEHGAQLEIAGDYRRYCEIIEELVFVIGVDEPALAVQQIGGYSPLDFEAHSDALLMADSPFGIKIKLHIVSKPAFGLSLFKLTGSQAHVDAVLKLAGEGPFNTEEDIYIQAGLASVSPEMREGFDELSRAKDGDLPNLITYEDLKGSLHNHSTWSDGVHTLEEMALYCRDELQLSYLGICDHSKSAFYAKGLVEARVEAQHNEIEALNTRLAPFKIFKGIESDILNDGSLDYSDEVLKTFDFVVASVHSNLRMDKQKATSRIITAVENPYTTILGHPTGRLLLSRKGYDIDYRKVIDACAANDVVIEINANPLRLDLDWRWHRYALERGVLLSINPDAHRKEKFRDMHYGVYMGRKGGLSASSCLNALSLSEITEYFDTRKAKIASS